MSTSSKVDQLATKQLEKFGLTDKTRLTSVKSAEKFLKNVGIALRYWRAEKIPMASLYQAAVGSPGPPPKEKDTSSISLREESQRIAIELTNHLLGSHYGIEVNMIASRIVIVHRDLVPSLYVLVRRHKSPDDLTGVSTQARKVFQFVEQNKETTAGLVRKYLGMPVVDLNNDPAYNALAELQSHFLIDRGPFLMRKSGIPYLSKEGYPYHSFHGAHPDLVKASVEISCEEAARNFIHGYLKGAVFVTDKKLTSLFGNFITRREIDDAIDGLVKQKKVLTTEEKRSRVVFIRN